MQRSKSLHQALGSEKWRIISTWERLRLVCPCGFRLSPNPTMFFKTRCFRFAPKDTGGVFRRTVVAGKQLTKSS